MKKSKSLDEYSDLDTEISEQHMSPDKLFKVESIDVLALLDKYRDLDKEVQIFRARIRSVTTDPAIEQLPADKRFVYDLYTRVMPEKCREFFKFLRFDEKNTQLSALVDKLVVELNNSQSFHHLETIEILGHLPFYEFDPEDVVLVSKIRSSLDALLEINTTDSFKAAALACVLANHAACNYATGLSEIIVPKLIRIIAADFDDFVKIQAVSSLLYCDKSAIARYLEIIRDQLYSKNPNLGTLAAAVIGSLGREAVNIIPSLVKMVSRANVDEQVRYQFAVTLTLLDPEGSESIKCGLSDLEMQMLIESIFYVSQYRHYPVLANRAAYLQTRLVVLHAQQTEQPYYTGKTEIYDPTLAENADGVDYEEGDINDDDEDSVEIMLFSREVKPQPVPHWDKKLRELSSASELLCTFPKEAKKTFFPFLDACQAVDWKEPIPSPFNNKKTYDLCFKLNEKIRSHLQKEYEDNPRELNCVEFASKDNLISWESKPFIPKSED